MEELYTPEVRDRDAEMSQALLAQLDPAAASIAASLMEISFRSGLQAGRVRASNVLAVLA